MLAIRRFDWQAMDMSTTRGALEALSIYSEEQLSDDEIERFVKDTIYPATRFFWDIDFKDVQPIFCDPVNFSPPSRDGLSIFKLYPDDRKGYEKRSVVLEMESLYIDPNDSQPSNIGAVNIWDVSTFEFPVNEYSPEADRFLTMRNMRSEAIRNLNDIQRRYLNQESVRLELGRERRLNEEDFRVIRALIQILMKEAK